MVERYEMGANGALLLDAASCAAGTMAGGAGADGCDLGVLIGVRHLDHLL